ncbi:Imm40 family immunity protein [Pseudomonas sp. MWU13-2105]|uniref:Imm40 family immunity protein n=1 Tax=Pseudomonas sp. MWU13-2105 TaxID=2935074 RepID=UPI00200CD3A0|nr:Imm40 family immunity protein [Pseudomonas sp. MWU13-2105]
MAGFWSEEIDAILGVGDSLESIGVRNWALTAVQAIEAIARLSSAGVAILGGDVYSLESGCIEQNYDSWFCNKNNFESEADFVVRSALKAKEYIERYDVSKGGILFALVPVA